MFEPDEYYPSRRCYFDWRGAFSNCSSLTSITLPEGVTSIGYWAFFNCYSLTSITIPEGVTSIGNTAFYGCSSLTSITIPESVTSIGENPFDGCANLKEFNGKFASTDGRCLIVDGVLNSFAPAGLTEYTIPESVSVIGESAFDNCSSLTSITLPEGVTSIEENPFDGCANLKEFSGKFASTDGRCLIVDGVLNSFAPAGLTEYTIPEGVTSIGGYTFCYCKSLTSVTIPEGVTSIGYHAFNSCSSLKSVYCKPTTPPNGGSNMFYSNASGRKIYVPASDDDSIINAYKTAGYWKDYADAIEEYEFD